MLALWAGGLLLIGMTLTLLFRQIHPFLAVRAPVAAKILVVDGWLPDYALKEAAAEFHQGGYQTLITIGAPLPQGFYLSQYQNHADLGAATLAKLGVPAEQMVALPVPYAAKDRTFTAALVVKNWLLQTAAESPVEAINLYTLGPHARRSRLLFRRAFSPQTSIGILSAVPQNYQPDRWWHYSAGVREVLFEGIAYLYALFFVF